PQLSIGDKRDPLAVGRKKRAAASVGTRYRRARELVDVAHVDALATSPPCDVREAAPIGRDGDGGRIEREPFTRRRRHDEARNGSRVGWRRRSSWRKGPYQERRRARGHDERREHASRPPRAPTIRPDSPQ